MTEGELHYHVDEMMYEEEPELGEIALFLEEAVAYIRTRAMRLGIDLIDDEFKGDHRATWTLRACTLNCESKSVRRFLELMAQLD